MAKKLNRSRRPGSREKSAGAGQGPKPEGKAESPVQKAPAEISNQADRPLLAGYDFHVQPSKSDSRTLHAATTSAGLAMRAAIAAHEDAVHCFENVNISNSVALKRCTEDLQNARSAVIIARQRLLDLNRTNG